MLKGKNNNHIERTTIVSATLYKLNIFARKKFSFATWTSRQHVFLALKTHSLTGWGENIISVNCPEKSLEEWGTCVRDIVGLDIHEALHHVRRKISLWEDRVSEITECAVLDLIAQTEGKSAVEYLDLEGVEPVYGVHVILSDDVQFVADETEWAVNSGKSKFIKVKLFGDPDVDLDIVRAVRSVTPRTNTFLIGDVNGGYGSEDNKIVLPKLSEQLRLLYDAGLDACEDPAYISHVNWVKLQESVAPLALIPDYPMRPAAKAQRSLLPNMGLIYNIHPGTSGSILDAISLARHVQQTGAQLMIGDDSFVGPGCTIWQQLAIGLGAAWVEATEKRGESDGFETTILHRATDPSMFPIQMKPGLGFGLSLDESILKDQAAEWLTIH